MLLIEYLESTCPPGHKNSIALEKANNGPKITYKSLFNQAKKLSKFFSPNSVIASCLDNSIENVVLFLGITTSIGCAISPLNPDYKESEFDYFLKQAPGGLVVSADRPNFAAESAARKIGLTIYRVSVQVDGTITMVKTKGASSAHAVSSNDLPTGTALVLYTSGTTGAPKRVPLTHANMIASIKNIVGTYTLSPSDITYGIMPLFHMHGLLASIFSTLGSGGRILMPSVGKFSPSVFWKEVAACTWYTAVPTMHQILLQVPYPGEYKVAPLRFIRSCSSALAPAVLEKMEQRYDVQVLEAYAMTEACHQMTSNPMSAPGSMYLRRSGTVGRAHGGVSIKILDQAGIEVARGTRGEICVRGDNVMPGYVNNEKANRESFVNGFFRTGDEGMMDKDGFITITGRIKELINRGGEKISPLEVDAVLLSHPAVAEAVSFGIPDAKYGEVVGAAVILKAGQKSSADEILTFVKSKVSSFKVPVKLFFSANMPKTATGKIQRRLVAQHFLTQGSKL